MRCRSSGRMKDFSGAAQGNTLAPIHDRHVHMHEREAKLDASRTAHDFDRAGEALQRSSRGVSRARLVVPVADVDLNYRIDVEPVIFWFR